MTQAEQTAIVGPGIRGGVRVQAILGSLRARLIARYQLVLVPGRPEELLHRGSGAIVSTGYGCGTIRVRQHGGANNRTWQSHIDLQIRDGWHAEVFGYLDPFFGLLPTARRANV